MKYIRIILLSLVAFSARENAFSQIVLKKGDTTYNNWGYSVVHLESIYTSAGSPAHTDTLNGTAFLVNDHNKLYLVTAKHLVLASLFKKDQRSINHNLSVFVFTTQLHYDLSPAGKPAPGSYFLSSDADDVAIFSLPDDKLVLDHFFKKCRPVDISLFDNMTYAYKRNEPILVASSSTWLNKGKKSLTYGIGVDTIGDHSPSEFFTIKAHHILQGNDGAPLMGDNKLIGIISRQSGIHNNEDVITQPYYVARSAKCIKTSAILRAFKNFKKQHK